MASSSIFTQYLQPPRPMSDYSADLDKQEANQLALAGQRQGMADQQALRQATQSFGSDSAANLNALQRAGLYKQAQDYQKATLEGQKTQGDIAETASKIPLNAAHATQAQADADAKRQDMAFKAHDKHLQDLQAVSSPDEFMQWVKSGVGTGALDLNKAAAIAQALQQDPAQFPAIKQKMLANGIALKDQYVQEQEMKRAQLASQTQLATNQLTTDTSRRGQDIAASTARRGQDMTDARSKESTAATMTKPFEVTGPDGNPLLVQQDKQGNVSPVAGYGPKVGSSKPLNDTQAKALGFGTRMQEADKLLNTLDAKGVSTPSLAKLAVGDAPFLGPVANALSTPDQQSVDQAQRDFVNAVLRRESGAAISDSEFANARKQYFAQPGDSNQVKTQKAANRKLSMEGVLAEVPKGQRGTIGPQAPQGGAKVVNFGDLK